MTTPEPTDEPTDEPTSEPTSEPADEPTDIRRLIEEGIAKDPDGDWELYYSDPWNVYLAEHEYDYPVDDDNLPYSPPAPEEDEDLPEDVGRQNQSGQPDQP